MSGRLARLRPRRASSLLNLSPRTVSVETFTVIHIGAEIDESVAAGLLDAVSDWAAAAELGVTRLVEVWGSPWARLMAGGLATAAAVGGPPYLTERTSTPENHIFMKP